MAVHPEACNPDGHAARQEQLPRQPAWSPEAALSSPAVPTMNMLYMLIFVTD
jgi:hypothetical protein